MAWRCILPTLRLSKGEPEARPYPLTDSRERGPRLPSIKSWTNQRYVGRAEQCGASGPGPLSSRDARRPWASYVCDWLDLNPARMQRTANADVSRETIPAPVSVPGSAKATPASARTRFRQVSSGTSGRDELFHVKHRRFELDGSADSDARKSLRPFIGDSMGSEGITRSMGVLEPRDEPSARPFAVGRRIACREFGRSKGGNPCCLNSKAAVVDNRLSRQSARTPCDVLRPPSQRPLNSRGRTPGVGLVRAPASVGRASLVGFSDSWGCGGCFT